VNSRISDRIRGFGRGWVFFPTAFLDLGSRNAVASTLKRMKASGTIRQLARGLYDYPRHDKKKSFLDPSMDAIAKALIDRDGIRFQLSGADAAISLGLSAQASIRASYLTDGRNRKMQLGRTWVLFKHTTPKRMATAGRISGTVIQALRWLGPANMDGNVVKSLRRHLSKDEKQQLIKDIRYVPNWATEIIRQVAIRE
jgi:hypothetical protein